MKLLLDSSVIIFRFEQPHSNSRIVFDAIIEGRLQGVVSEKAIEEVKKVLSYRNGEKFAYLTEDLIRRNFEVIPLKKVEKETEKWKGKIKEKDLAHLATAKALGLKFIVALDRDFAPFKEYHTPKKFVENVLKLKGFESEY